MAVTTMGETAKIFEFPVGGRKFGRRNFDTTGTIAELRPQPVLVVDYNCWYHDEAVREDQTPKS